MSENKKNIAILGSTGSIGKQALDVVRNNPERFEVFAITANNSIELLIEQAIEFQPEVVAIANENHYIALKDGSQCLFRPILPEDEPALQRFIAKVTKEDLYYRYFSEINEFTHEDLANMTQIDYDREMAFVAVRCKDNQQEILGVTRAISDPDNVDAEFAVLVRSDLKGLGLGRRLMEKLIAYTRDHGLIRLNGITMPNNRGMVALARKLGFVVDVQLEEGIVGLTLNLAQFEES